MKAMVGKFFAVWLVALSVLPCTAPFVTCPAPSRATEPAHAGSAMAQDVPSEADDAIVAAERVDSANRLRIASIGELGVAWCGVSLVVRNASSCAPHSVLLHTPTAPPILRV